MRLRIGHAFMGALVVLASGRVFAQTANPPPGWLAELPSVEKVKAAMPPGKDSKETLTRQAAAFGVLEDVIELFTGKTDFDLSRSQQPPEAYARFREYRREGELYPGPKGEIWSLAASRAFREEALAKILSPAMQKAYWDVRSGTMAAADKKRDTGRSLTLAATAALPPVDKVKADMQGENRRDTNQRINAALAVLIEVARGIPSPEAGAKVRSYEAAMDDSTHPVKCHDEPGCDEVITGAVSRSYWCWNAYSKSWGFARWVLDRYPVPEAALNDIAKRSQRIANALTEPPSTGTFKASARAASMPDRYEGVNFRACTTSGQFPEAAALTKAAAGHMPGHDTASDEAFDQALTQAFGPTLNALGGALYLASSPDLKKPYEFPDAKPSPAVAIAKKAGVDMKVLGGIPLGAPMRTLAPCADTALAPGKTCVVPPAMAAAFAMGGVTPPAGAVFLGNPGGGSLTWVRFVYGDVRDGVLVRVGVSTAAHGPLEYLKKKYGPPKAAAGQPLEWTKPGLRITYSPPELENMPSTPGRAPTYKCVPGTDCDGSDELNANFWSALPGAIGEGALKQAATRPNLVFEAQVGD